MKKIILGLILQGILITFCMKAQAQKVDDDTIINNIRSAVTEFFVKKGILNRNEIGNSLKYVFVIEIKDKKNLGYNTNGIYRIGVFQSHSVLNVLIKENSQFEIFDLMNINETIKGIITYSIENNLNADKLFIYLKEVMRMYESNAVMEHDFQTKKINK